MHDYIDKLIEILNLTSYQENKIKSNYDRYNVSRLEKRGGVLYAPYIVRGFWERVSCMLFGVRADLIGQNRTLLRSQRNIKFYANGLHCVKVGRYTYYANANGKILSRYEFKQELKN